MMYAQEHPSPLVVVDLRNDVVDPVDIVQEHILEIVNLSGMSLDSLPNPSLNLSAICKLDLSCNNLQNIPESLTARLVNVVVLDVHSNQLKSLPNSIGCLSKLKVLNVAGNLLTLLPRTIGNCRCLEELNANFNKLSQLPEKIGLELVKLTKLSVNSNKLATLPRSITNLICLKTLDARLNNLRSLPEDLENLINLQVLNVSQNFQYLETLPYSIGLLISLVELDLSYNRISILPDSIGCLRKLQKLNVKGNPLVFPPVHVMELGLHTVKEYLSDKMMAGQKGPQKKKSWVGKLATYGSLNGRGNIRNNILSEEREGFIMGEYQSIDGLASPRYTSASFSPRRLFSTKRIFTR